MKALSIAFLVFYVVAAASFGTNEGILATCPPPAPGDGAFSEAGIPADRGRMGLLMTVRFGGGQPQVMAVTPGLPGHRAGIRRGDRVLEVNGEALDLRDDIEMIDYFGRFKAGERLKFLVERESELLSVEFVTEPMPPEVAQALWGKREEFRQRMEAGLDPYACDAADPMQGEAFMKLLEGWAQEAPGNTILVRVEPMPGQFLVRVPTNGMERRFPAEDLPAWSPDMAKRLANGETISFTLYSRQGHTRLRKVDE